MSYLNYWYGYIKLYRMYFIRNSYKYYKYIYKLIRGFPGYCLEFN